MWGESTSDYSFHPENEWLITNLSQELSANLETSPLFEDSLLDCDLPGFENEHRRSLSSHTTDIFDIEGIKVEENVEYLDDIYITENTSPSSSSSEICSSENASSSKGDLDTPPTSPHNLVSPETICLISQVDGSRFSLPVANASVKAIACKSGTVFQKLESTPLSREECQRQQAQRKRERMIRNRESAYLSRKRAKEKVVLMEEQVLNLTQENLNLKQENAALKRRLAVYEPVVVKRTWHKISTVPKRTTALLAIAVTLCINLTSYGLLEDGLRSSDIGPQATDEHHTRSLLWVEAPDDASLANLTTSCPLAINRTESLRLERELREWIVGGDGSTKPDQSSQKNSSGRRRRIPRAHKVRTFPVDMWGLRASVLDLEGLYEAIHRRADTFYLVSFSADHLLLPAATSTNATNRPKMSVMLPAFLANSSFSANGAGRVEMMQIDCEVTNTKLLSVSDNDIPLHLRHASPKFPNASITTDDTVNLGGNLQEIKRQVRFDGNLSRTSAHAPMNNSLMPPPAHAPYYNSTHFYDTHNTSSFEPYHAEFQKNGKHQPIASRFFILKQNVSLSTKTRQPGN